MEDDTTTAVPASPDSIYAKDDKIVFSIVGEYYALEHDALKPPMSGVILPLYPSTERAREIWDELSDEGWESVEVEESEKTEDLNITYNIGDNGDSIVVSPSNSFVAGFNIEEGDDKMFIHPDGRIELTNEDETEEMNLWDLIKDMKEIKKHLTT